MATPEKDLVIKAINELGRRVTAADIATKTGLPLLTATSTLNKVAAEANGHLQVSNAGDIAYSFDPGFQSAYVTEGFKKTLQEVWEKVFKVGFFLVRISFGVGLIVSFVLVCVLIIAMILFVQRGGDGDNDRGGGFGGGLGGIDFFDWMLLRNFFWWGPTYPIYTPYGYNDYSRPYELYDRPTTRQPETENNFIMNCFSFLFGDGAPNLNLEERKWQLIAQIIKQNNGVVTAEQLAPYTGADPKNDDAVLPVLVRFDGKPEVTANGNIVYTFPSLQVTANTMSFSALPTYLREFNWEFTRVSAGALVPVFILAGLNFLGALFLVTHLYIPILHAFAGLIHWLALYGTMFVAVPAIRWLILNVLNGDIEKRNAAKKDYADALHNPSAETLRKLGEAKNYRIGEKSIRKDDVVYTTDRDVIDQDFNNEDKQFDEQLRQGAQKNPQSNSKQPHQSSQQQASEPDHIISLNPKEQVDVKPQIKSKRPWQ